MVLKTTRTVSQRISAPNIGPIAVLFAPWSSTLIAKSAYQGPDITLEPILLYLAYKHHFDVKTALLANTNTGGDNVHRGMVLGLLVGAASETVREDLTRGLTDYNALNKEIRIFSEIAISGQAIY